VKEIPQPADPTPATAQRASLGIPDLEMLVSGGDSGPCTGLTYVLRAPDPALRNRAEKSARGLFTRLPPVPFRPLVFLNACETGGSSRDLLGLGGWPARFLAAGAGAFLGTYWTVSGNAARAFSQGFYRRPLFLRSLRKIWRDIQEPRAAGGKGRLPLLEKTTAATFSPGSCSPIRKRAES
jgi:hypothetical protein